MHQGQTCNDEGQALCRSRESCPFQMGVCWAAESLLIFAASGTSMRGSRNGRGAVAEERRRGGPVWAWRQAGVGA